MSERVLVMAVLVGLGLEAWRGWAQSAGTPLPHPSIFTAFLVVIALLGVLATFAPPLAAILAVGVLVAIALGATNPLLATPAKAAA
ncbi:MAG: hypothetical protein ACHQX0_05120 [Desulfobaccales bacterium]